MNIIVEYVNEPRRLRGLSVLVLDNSFDNVELISQVLVRNGASVRSTSKVDRAYLEKNILHFDLILVDLHMPELDGFAVAKMLREMNYRGSVIALTTSRLENVFKRCIGAGFTTVISRPFSLNELVERIHNIFWRILH